MPIATINSVNKKIIISFLILAGIGALLIFCAFVQNYRKSDIKMVLKEQQHMNRSIVLLNNQSGIIPLKVLTDRKIATVSMGSAYSVVFDSLLNKYAPVKSFSSTSYKSGSLSMDDLIDDLKFYNTVVIQVTEQSLNDPETLRFILDNQANKEIILAGFGNFTALKKLDAISAPIIWSPDYDAVTAGYAAQLIFGGVEAKGKLGQNISPKFRLGDGFVTKKIRLKYTVPEEVGIKSADLEEIDLIVAEAIRERATPSAVVMVVKDGNVIFNKAYGAHTYGGQPTRIGDIYDLASVTKISATTMAVMRLYEQQKLKLDTNVGAYIPKARKTGSNNIAVREVMLHQAGFVPFIPFYTKVTVADYRRDSSNAFPVKVADDYFLKKNYFEDVMWPQMLNAPVTTRGKYVYSDLSMYFMKEIVERQSGKPLNKYVTDEFYRPLGMYTAGFNPRYRFGKERIVPTEQDTSFRKTLLHGYVHDPGAAMVNGVSGHAGLFASANDLAILYQMILNRGTYGGVEYFKSKTVDMFTKRQSDVNRRGLGFDRWDPENGSNYPSKLASSQTYGHTGYTGTCVWVDPKYNLVYIFLSNRVHPSVDAKLLSLRIRPRIQDVVYEAIQKIKK
ncbi:MAG TPA: serine hydrolase [Sphingobacteriaceae bacterium]|nr:serine hydrolase [Sphingobacteriaceae bacterium]